MTVLDVDGLNFTFPAKWVASKYDEWTFYREHFVKQDNGIRAVDIVALSPQHCAFFIEVKDYRHPDTVLPSELPKVIAAKVLHTLAAILPAKLLANDPAEVALATAILKCKSLRVVAHLEQPQRHKQIVDPADIKQKLKKLLRAVDHHPKIMSMSAMHNAGWTVV